MSKTKQSVFDRLPSMIKKSNVTLIPEGNTVKKALPIAQQAKICFSDKFWIIRKHFTATVPTDSP